ncbi:Gfo/Idh/MocA family oxidoreductase [Actinophytocola sp.]|jgi:predicted dehydrogenase|uniref:Gfo/Idh/MocA family protein n=1 Tax=Actinophytocola sp. TaxID=1872138 RepID=UPI002ED81AC3
MERDSAFGVLIVGTGAIAELHIAALRASDRAELVGLVDTDPARAAAASYANGGVRSTTDLTEALAWPEVDGVIVCTPNGSHATIAHAVAAAGKHLLVEKPLATTTVDALAVLEDFRRAGRVLATAQTHRAYDYSLAVKSALDSGRIGDPLVIRATLLGGWIWGDWRSWAIDPGASGGHSLHNGVHLLDLVCWWMGARPDSVYARGRKQTAGELEIYDYLELVLRFPGNKIAQCEMSRAHRPGVISHRDVQVIGTAGTLSLPWDAEPSLVLDEQGMSVLLPAGGNGFARQLTGWLDAIAGGDALASGEDGLAAVAMAEAAELSIATGQPVPLTALAVEVVP